MRVQCGPILSFFISSLFHFRSQVHPTKEVFAVGEKGLDPNIYIYEYPSLKVIRILRKGTERAYCDMEFEYVSPTLTWMSIFSFNDSLVPSYSFLFLFFFFSLVLVFRVQQNWRTSIDGRLGA